jgi:transcription-repair coupling factor (superfamily II helicase)
MTLKMELRRLRALGCEANARLVTLHLRDDTPLDPAKITALIRRSGGAWKLTPDMRLSRRFGGAADAIANAETALADLVNLER